MVSSRCFNQQRKPLIHKLLKGVHRLDTQLSTTISYRQLKNAVCEMTCGQLNALVLVVDDDVFDRFFCVWESLV